MIRRAFARTILVLSLTGTAVVGAFPHARSAAVPTTVVRTVEVSTRAMLPAGRNRALAIRRQGAIQAVARGRTAPARVCAPIWFTAVAFTWVQSGGRRRGFARRHERERRSLRTAQAARHRGCGGSGVPGRADRPPGLVAALDRRLALRPVLDGSSVRGRALEREGRLHQQLRHLPRSRDRAAGQGPGRSLERPERALRPAAGRGADHRARADHPRPVGRRPIALELRPVLRAGGEDGVRPSHRRDQHLHAGAGPTTSFARSTPTTRGAGAGATSRTTSWSTSSATCSRGERAVPPFRWSAPRRRDSTPGASPCP